MSSIQSRFLWASHEMLGVAVYAAKELFSIEVDTVITNETDERQYEYTLAAMFSSIEVEMGTENLSFVFQDRAGNQFIVCIDPQDATYWESGGTQQYQAPKEVVALLEEEEQEEHIKRTYCEAARKEAPIESGIHGRAPWCSECGEDVDSSSFFNSHTELETQS